MFDKRKRLLNITVDPRNISVFDSRSSYVELMRKVPGIERLDGRYLFDDEHRDVLKVESSLFMAAQLSHCDPSKTRLSAHTISLSHRGRI